MDMNKKSSVIITVVIIVLILVLCFGGYFLVQSYSGYNRTEQKKNEVPTVSTASETVCIHYYT